MKEIPLIKEHRVDKIRECLKCFDHHPFNRDRQKDCILGLYPGKSDKSVFRGMIIPSLRHLGLIVGYRDVIRLSANGKILIVSESISEETSQRALCAIVYELDKKRFGFLDDLSRTEHCSKEDLFEHLKSLTAAKNEGQKLERISHWFSILMQTELIRQISGHIIINETRLKQTLADTQRDGTPEEFEKYLFATYFESSKESPGIADIADLREKVAIRMLKEKRVILTEDAFDKLLREIPFSTDEYVISFGKTMGVEEKLFKYKDNYYRTLHIRLLSRR